jgi:hypothetical protein
MRLPTLLFEVLRDKTGEQCRRIELTGDGSRLARLRANGFNGQDVAVSGRSQRHEAEIDRRRKPTRAFASIGKRTIAVRCPRSSGCGRVIPRIQASRSPGLLNETF